MNNQKLIRELAKDIQETKTMSRARFVTLFTVFSAVALLLNFLLLPAKSDIHFHLTTPIFYIDSLLWLSLAVVSANAAFSHLIPGINSQKSDLLFYFLFSGLFIFVLSKLQFGEGVYSHFQQELQFYRGPCFVLIISTGVFHLLTMSKIVKMGLIYSPIKFSFIFSVATGSIGAAAMQVICVHESAEHILIWHYPCFFALSVISFYLFRKVR